MNNFFGCDVVLNDEENNHYKRSAFNRKVFKEYQNEKFLSMPLELDDNQ